MAEFLNVKLNGHVIRRITIAIFCAFIGVCSLVVMLGFYNPNQNALGALSSVCMDIICMIILFIIIGSFAFGSYSANRTSRLFAVLLVATMWAVFLDFLNWAFDGALEFWHLTYWFTVGSLCMGSILACIFSIYMYSYMEETHRLSKMRPMAMECAGLNLVSFVITFALAMTGTAFEFVDGHYETGALYDVVAVLPILTLLYLTCYVIGNVKIVGIHDTLAVAGYIFFMIAGALIESVYRIGTTYVAVSIADIFIFVMLQNEIIAREKRNAQEWMKISHTDELTGFYNRHAYESDIKALEDSKLRDDFVYILADVNSLKNTNDSLGHGAGDEMLVGAASCLGKCFGTYGKMYRIGGDEFVALIYTDEENLLILKNKLEDITNAWTGENVESLSLSCGYVSMKESEGMTIRQVAELADQKMYEAKDDYYNRTGNERRKK